MPIYYYIKQFFIIKITICIDLKLVKWWFKYLLIYCDSHYWKYKALLQLFYKLILTITIDNWFFNDILKLKENTYSEFSFCKLQKWYGPSLNYSSWQSPGYD